ncbi:MAG: hypothetical protein ACOX81_10030 [Candidatus Heteroscillospira sp.]|jgi:hypothetical protein
MSHTLHRRGTPESLAKDYVVFAMSAKGINADNSNHALKEFLEIVSKYNWVNMGDMKTGGYFLVGNDAIMEGVQDTSIVHGVFASKEDMKAAVQEIRDADLGVSVTISGILTEVRDAVESEGIHPHTVEVSMGIKGRTDKLPEDDLLQITTMCGHGMVSQTLVRQMLIDIKRGRRTAEEAGKYLATPCVCGVFNPKRAAEILEELLDVWCLDED